MTSSSDEEIHHKPCTFLSLSSSSHICLMAKGMNDSDVSDDDSCPSIHELVDLVRTQEVAITRLLSKNKELKGKLASSSSNYKELAEKIDMIIDQNNELTKKIELLEQTITIYKKASKSIIETKKDASTSCIDLIDESSSPSCNEICVENVVVETCDDLIAQENEELKQEVTMLTRDLTWLKEKKSCDECKKQPSQDNRPKMVKKLEKGATMTCHSCHQEGVIAIIQLGQKVGRNQDGLGG
jgi:septal ring factor EnvC (AmiA/AmiB activator)